MTTATITVGEGRPSRYSDSEGALDHHVRVEVGGRVIDGRVTLLPDAINGGYSSWGESIDTWCSGTLVAWMETLTRDSAREVTRALESGEGTEERDVQFIADIEAAAEMDRDDVDARELADRLDASGAWDWSDGSEHDPSDRLAVIESAGAWWCVYRGTEPDDVWCFLTREEAIAQLGTIRDSITGAER